MSESPGNDPSGGSRREVPLDSAWSCGTLPSCAMANICSLPVALGTSCAGQLPLPGSFPATSWPALSGELSARTPWHDLASAMLGVWGSRGWSPAGAVSRGAAAAAVAVLGQAG